MLFVDGGAVGMDALLSRYHLVPHPAIVSDPLPAHGGALIAGIVLKNTKPKTVSGSHKECLKVQLNQLNGQLPNLDLFNSVVKIAGKHGIYLETVIYDVYDYQKVATLVLFALLIEALPVGTGLAPVDAPPSRLYPGFHLDRRPSQRLRQVRPPGTDHHLIADLLQLSRPVHATSRRHLPLPEQCPGTAASELLYVRILFIFRDLVFRYILVNEDLFLSIAYYMPCMAVAVPLLLFVSILFDLTWFILSNGRKRSLFWEEEAKTNV